MAMATNAEAVPNTLLVENKRLLLPHSCFDHDIFTSSSLMTFEGSTYWRLSPHPLWAQRQGSPVFAYRHLDEQNSFPGSAGHLQLGCAHYFSAMVGLLLPLRVMRVQGVGQALFLAAQWCIVRNLFGGHLCPFAPGF
jgi:hypothetical protein